MSQDIRNLEPKALWNHFADLNAVPRASKKEERVIQFALDFAKSLDLPHVVDEVGNVIIKKPATSGMESKQTVVLQSHLDMVHQKNADTVFDFDTEGIKMLIDGDWVHADGTTLGADNGIGVATIMALLSSTDIPHPPLEALFTIDEETGMTGALGLKGGLLSGSIMLNLDTEDDDELSIGCAGGIDITINGEYIQGDVADEHLAYKLMVKGLTGGHSGMDIHKGRGNANKILTRLLLRLEKAYSIEINTIDGGGLRNAIPREAYAIIYVKSYDVEAIQNFISEQSDILKSELKTTDPNFSVSFEASDANAKIADHKTAFNLLRSCSACQNGIYRMSPDIDNLVQTSNNLARIELKDGKYKVLCLTRSSVETEKADLVDTISSAFELSGGTITTSGTYPGWKPKPEAAIVGLMSNIYREKFNEEPHVMACHAGLECGILGQNYPEMDMISFGPNIRGAHSPDEKVQVSSVQKFWDYLLDTLKQIPERE